MADIALRSLARVADPGGDLDSRVRLLRERVRVGDLSAERLRVAAAIGDPAACAAMGESVPTFERGRQAWLESVLQLGPAVSVRVTCALGRARLTGWHEPVPTRGHLKRLLLTAERWITCPCERCRAACVRAYRQLLGFEVTVDRRTSSGRVFSTVQTALCSLVPEFWRGARRTSLAGVLSPAICRAVVADLVPWVLGECDPLVDRVRALPELVDPAAPSADWPFPVSPSTDVVVHCAVVGAGRPILRVVRDAETGGWFFFGGEEDSEFGLMVITLGEVVALDASVGEVLDLPSGTTAHRVAAGQPWVRERKD